MRKGGLDSGGEVGEVEPDFYAAEMRAFGANRRGDAGAKMARGADVASELRVDFTELGDLVKRGFVDFFLSVETSAHGPFVEEVQKGTGFDEADGFGVRENIEGDFGGDAAVEKLIFCGPGVTHGADVDFLFASVV